MSQTDPNRKTIGETAAATTEHHEARDHAPLAWQPPSHIVSGSEQPSHPKAIALQNSEWNPWRWWQKFANPDESRVEVWRRLPGETEVLRRGRVLTVLLFATLIAALVGVLLVTPQALNDPTLTNLIDVGILLTICGILLLSGRLNATGHTELAALLAGFAIMLVIAIGIALTDIPNGGYDWIDAPGWDTMCIGVGIISFTSRPFQAWLAFLGHVLILLGFVVFVPQDPHILAVDLSSGMAGNFPTPFQEVGLLIDLLFRPVIISAFLTMVGITIGQSIINALRDRDVQLGIAQQQQLLLVEGERLLDERRQQEKWALESVARLERAFSSGKPFDPPALPQSWMSDPQMSAFNGLMRNAGRRIAEGQQAMGAFRILQERAQRLPFARLQMRANGSRADGTGPVDELLLITEVPGGLGYPPADAYLTAVNHFLRELIEEETTATEEMVTRLYVYSLGDTRARISDEATTRRFGPIAHAINLMLDHLPPNPGTLQ